MAKKHTSPSMAVYRPKPEASIHLGKGLKLPKLRVGGTITVEVTGRVTSVNDDEYSRGFRMTIKSVDCDNGMGSDMGNLHATRRY